MPYSSFSERLSRLKHDTPKFCQILDKLRSNESRIVALESAGETLILIGKTGEPTMNINKIMSDDNDDSIAVFTYNKGPIVNTAMELTTNELSCNVIMESNKDFIIKRTNGESISFLNLFDNRIPSFNTVNFVYHHGTPIDLSKSMYSHKFVFDNIPRIYFSKIPFTTNNTVFYPIINKFQIEFFKNSDVSYNKNILSELINDVSYNNLLHDLQSIEIIQNNTNDISYNNNKLKIYIKDLKTETDTNDTSYNIIMYLKNNLDTVQSDKLQLTGIKLKEPNTISTVGSIDISTNYYNSNNVMKGIIGWSPSTIIDNPDGIYITHYDIFVDISDNSANIFNYNSLDTNNSGDHSKIFHYVYDVSTSDTTILTTDISLAYGIRQLIYIQAVSNINTKSTIPNIKTVFDISHLEISNNQFYPNKSSNTTINLSINDTVNLNRKPFPIITDISYVKNTMLLDNITDIAFNRDICSNNLNTLENRQKIFISLSGNYYDISNTIISGYSVDISKNLTTIQDYYSDQSGNEDYSFNRFNFWSVGKFIDISFNSDISLNDTRRYFYGTIDVSYVNDGFIEPNYTTSQKNIVVERVQEISSTNLTIRCISNTYVPKWISGYPSIEQLNFEINGTINNVSSSINGFRRDNSLNFISNEVFNFLQNIYDFSNSVINGIHFINGDISINDFSNCDFSDNRSSFNSPLINSFSNIEVFELFNGSNKSITTDNSINIYNDRASSVVDISRLYTKFLSHNGTEPLSFLNTTTIISMNGEDLSNNRDFSNNNIYDISGGLILYNGYYDTSQNLYSQTNIDSLNTKYFSQNDITNTSQHIMNRDLSNHWVWGLFKIKNNNFIFDSDVEFSESLFGSGSDLKSFAFTEIEFSGCDISGIDENSTSDQIKNALYQHMFLSMSFPVIVDRTNTNPTGLENRWFIMNLKNNIHDFTGPFNTSSLSHIISTNIIVSENFSFINRTDNSNNILITPILFPNSKLNNSSQESINSILAIQHSKYGIVISNGTVNLDWSNNKFIYGCLFGYDNTTFYSFSNNTLTIKFMGMPFTCDYNDVFFNNTLKDYINTNKNIFIKVGFKIGSINFKFNDIKVTIKNNNQA